MSIPKLYTVLPLKDDGNPDVDVLTSHSSEVIVGSDDEKFVVLSYFPKTLKYSERSDFTINKYVLFVLNQDEDKKYTVDWSYDVTDSQGSVIDRFVREEIAGPSFFEFSIGLRDLSIPETRDWELTLKIECTVSKNGVAEELLELEQTILPIEADLLSENGASFEDESGVNNSAVRLGNEGITHFMRGHLSEYLVETKENKRRDTDGDKDKNDENPNNASVFIHQTAAIAYINTLSVADALGPESILPGLDEELNGPFSWIFSNQDLEQTIINQREFGNSSYGDIGICSLNLHHVLPIVLGSEIDRVDTRTELLAEVKSAYKLNHDKFIIAYHRAVFPKSAINLSVDIFDRLFRSFKTEANETNHIFETFELALPDKKAKVAEWKKLEHSELRESSNDKFMKNLFANYYLGHYHTMTSEMVKLSRPEAMLKIDWSQFIQKLLNPSTITVPFTLIKIQVNDLRSGKPIANTLIKQLDFHSFETDPDYTLDKRFKYVIEHPHDTKLIIKPTDSRNKRIQKICKLMGYYTGGIDDSYGDGMRSAIYKYMSSWDRLLPTPVPAPESAAKERVDPKKDAWIDYILEDFAAHCMTDGDGILNCRVPDELLKDRKLNINVGFVEFSVVREIFDIEDRTVMTNKPIKRPISLDGTLKTYFEAHWVGDIAKETDPKNPNQQSLDWDKNLSGESNFGWKITEHTGLTPGNETSATNQLRLSLPLEVKKSKTEDYNKFKIKFSEYFDYGFTIEDYKHFSAYYSDTGIHFVLFGMQWCQPVWDEYDDKETINGVPKHSYIQDTKVKHPHMNVVTLNPKLRGKFGKYPGSRHDRYEEYGGKGYGKYEKRNAPDSVWRGGNGHQGYDIHAIIGANVFAFHNGTIKNNPNFGDAGMLTTIDWNKHNPENADEYSLISYAHLSEFLKENGDYVIAGTVVGKGGRTGNIDKKTIEDPVTKVKRTVKIKSLYPSHVHVNAGNVAGDVARAYYPKLRKTMDDYFSENAMVMPSNFSPLLFPCRGEVADPDWIPTSCELNDAKFVKFCWAAGELKCPYINKSMNKSNETILQLQSQLRYLNEKPATVESKDLNVEYKIKSEASSSFPNHLVDTSAFLIINKNTNYFHPYHPSATMGVLGDPITKIANSELATGTALRIIRTAHSNATYSLKEVTYEESPGVRKTTWIEKAFIGAGNTTTEAIQNVPAVKPSKTQMAIYTFRSQHSLLKMNDYYLNFTTDDEFWTELHKQCGF